MCGIAGIAGNPSPENRFSVERMVQAMRHRGPDAIGIESYADCCLGHARLSIVDLGTGQQPMFSADRRQAITFNGEIYGFRQIRQRLASSYNFITSSDTEVLLALYQKMGKKMLDVLPGMFAFAIWDENSKSLFCARDRFGEKPFYYATLPDGRFIFASELKALLRSSLINPDLDAQSVGHYFRHLYVHPHRCIYKNVNVLPPGHSLVFSKGQCSVEPYWELPSIRQGFIDEIEAAEELKRLFEASVKEQLVADVPVGIFLSGGLDSSSIVAAAASVTTKIQTYSFGFGESFDELPLAESMSRKYGTEHKVLYASDHKISDLMLKTAEIFDEPLGDSSTIPTFLISEAAGRECRVVLGGDGGDELLAGYNWYKILKAAQENIFAGPARFYFFKILGYVMRLYMPKWALNKSLKAQGIRLRQTFKTGSKIIGNLNCYFSNDELEKLGLVKEFEMFDKNVGGDWLDAGMRNDILNYLPGNILTKIDRAAMSCSLELRAPFLGREFAEFCISLPAKLKLKNETSKYILRLAFEDSWTEGIRQHLKQGFGAPVEKWLRLPDVQDLKNQIFMQPGSRVFDFIEKEAAKKVLEKNNYQSWIIIVFALWLEKHFKGAN